MQNNKLFPQQLIALNMVWVGHNRIIDRTNLLAGWAVIMTHTLSAAVNINLIDLIAHEYRLVGAFRLAHIAIDTAFGDQQSHIEAIPLVKEGA